MPVYQNPKFNQLSGGLAAVFELASRASFFSLPQWYDLMSEFGSLPPKRIRVYTDERSGSSGALPLRAIGGLAWRGLESCANFYSVEHGLVAAPDADLDRAVSAIVSVIQSERPRWDYLRLTELDPDEGAYRALVRELRRAGFLVETTPGAATWFEATRGMSFADYLAKRPSQLLNTWRRRRKNIATSGRLSARFFAGVGLEAAIADYQRIYANSWKPTEAFPQFIPALIGRAGELGALRMGIYYINAAPAAAQFWIVWKGRAIIYKLAHDRRFDGLSLGTLLTMDMVERVLEQDRPIEINFGRGDDPYKRLWLSSRRERWGITAANPRTLRGLRLGIERQAAMLYHRVRGEPIAPASVR